MCELNEQFVIGRQKKEKKYREVLVLVKMIGKPGACASHPITVLNNWC